MFLLFACSEPKGTPLLIKKDAVTFKHSPYVQQRVDNVLLMIRYMGTRDSFYCASITAYVKHKNKLGDSLRDSAHAYSKLIQSFNQSN